LLKATVTNETGTVNAAAARKIRRRLPPYGQSTNELFGTPLLQQLAEETALSKAPALNDGSRKDVASSMKVPKGMTFLASASPRLNADVTAFEREVPSQLIDDVVFQHAVWFKNFPAFCADFSRFS